MNGNLDVTGTKPNKTRKTVLSLVFGGLVGFLGATGVIALVEAGSFGTPDASQVIALLVALIYLLTGLMAALGVAAPRMGAKFLNVEDEDELLEQKQVLAASGWGMVALGLMLALIALGGPGGVLDSHVALVGAVLLGAIGTWLSMRSVKLADELMRATMNEAAATAYYFVFVVIGGWAMVSYLGYVPVPSMLDLLTLFWALVLVAAFWAAGRRGMLKQR